MGKGARRVFLVGTIVLLFPICAVPGNSQTVYKVCSRCEGDLRNGTAVGDLCRSNSSLEREGRCCLQKQALPSPIIGLDLWNCSLTQVEDLHEASAAVIIDLSDNPLMNISESAFQGFTSLRYLVLPSNLECPGGNTSWEHVELIGETVMCEGQKNACNGTEVVSWFCPENSLCKPDGPGLIQCNCAENFHGYKCLREGMFPMLKVFGILGVATVLVSAVLWFTQRRKAKSF
ncbi:all-trans retinoic acid-induced differentiation factor [Lepisosteus oculatus]|uniref:all-trans retinoic acid-induced differentiation factor n=1 Tax=Lepisosteus oculatus TaxID=7918 RepID=UPI0035F517EA